MITNVKKRLELLSPNTGTLILLGIAILLVVVIIGVLILSEPGSNGQNPNPITPTPAPIRERTSREGKVAPTQKTIIERTTEQEVKKLSHIEDVSVLSDGSIRYTFASPLVTRKNEVIVRNEKVIFERILVPENSREPGFITISEYKKQYGEPQRIIRGSHFYGNFIETFIYADKGFAFIGNSVTDEVFEVHTFAPTSVENYIVQYGSDINEEAPKAQL